MKFTTELMPHQAAAFEKLRHVKVGALYMEQGTGKTRTTLELTNLRMEAGKIDCILWLCPCSVKKSLREDIIYHCGDFPDKIIIRGIESLSSSDRLYLTLCELVQKHRVFLVVDESNLVKNHKAVRTGRIVQLSQACRYKMILNGTPVSKSEADMFAQWYVLDWRILGYKSFYSFAHNHIEYWTIHLPNGKDIEDRTRIRRILNIDYLTEKIAPYTYQVKKSECLPLPPKHYMREMVELTDKQEILYETTKREFLLNVDEMQPSTIYKLFTALQHVVSGRCVLSKADERMKTEPIFTWENNPRITALRTIVSNLQGKCIIFAKYQTELDDISKMLDYIGKRWVMYTGKVNQKQRQENRSAFRDASQFMLANKACGAYGLNLQFCNNIIYYSNDFDLATRMQSEDRVYRIGQTKEVHIVDLYTPDTIDGIIIDCLVKKENMVEAFKREINRWKGEKKPWTIKLSEMKQNKSVVNL